MALVISVLSRDLLNTILSMPAAVLGRLVKTEICRARTRKRTQRLMKRRPVSTVFRVPEIAPRNEYASVVGQRSRVGA